MHILHATGHRLNDDGSCVKSCEAMTTTNIKGNNYHITTEKSNFPPIEQADFDVLLLDSQVKLLLLSQ